MLPSILRFCFLRERVVSVVGDAEGEEDAQRDTTLRETQADCEDARHGKERQGRLSDAAGGGEGTDTRDRGWPAERTAAGVSGAERLPTCGTRSHQGLAYGDECRGRIHPALDERG